MRIYVHAHYWSETYLNTYERYGKPNTEAQRGMARERPQFNSGEHAIGTARQR